MQNANDKIKCSNYKGVTAVTADENRMRVLLVVCHDIYNSTHPQTPSEEVAWSQNRFCSECYKECYCVTTVSSISSVSQPYHPYHTVSGDTL